MRILFCIIWCFFLLLISSAENHAEVTFFEDENDFFIMVDTAQQHPLETTSIVSKRSALDRGLLRRDIHSPLVPSSAQPPEENSGVVRGAVPQEALSSAIKEPPDLSSPDLNKEDDHMLTEELNEKSKVTANTVLGFAVSVIILLYIVYKKML